MAEEAVANVTSYVVDAVGTLLKNRDGTYRRAIINGLPWFHPVTLNLIERPGFGTFVGLFASQGQQIGNLPSEITKKTRDKLNRGYCYTAFLLPPLQWGSRRGHPVPVKILMVEAEPETPEDRIAEFTAEILETYRTEVARSTTPSSTLRDTCMS